MMNIRRYYVPDSIVFITQVVDRRIPIFKDDRYVELLRSVLRQVKVLHPFRMMGYVFLPDHFHLSIQPTGESNFSQIMHSVKRNFTIAYKRETGLDGPMRFWQKGFWDHIIRSPEDFEHHLDYIHYNPVHHGLVARPEDWSHSSFLMWKERNVYPEKWGWSLPDSVANISQQAE